MKKTEPNTSRNFPSVVYCEFTSRGLVVNAEPTDSHFMENGQTYAVYELKHVYQAKVEVKLVDVK